MDYKNRVKMNRSKKVAETIENGIVTFGTVTLSIGVLFGIAYYFAK